MGILKTVTSPEIIAEKKKLSELSTALNNTRIEFENVQKNIVAVNKDIEVVNKNKAVLLSEIEKLTIDAKNKKSQSNEASAELQNILSLVLTAKKDLQSVNNEISQKNSSLKSLEQSYDNYITSVENAKKDMLSDFVAKFEKVKSLMS